MIWRNPVLEDHLAEHQEDLQELARYRRDCSQAAMKNQRERAKKWRQRCAELEEKKVFEEEKKKKEEAEKKAEAEKAARPKGWGLLRSTVLDAEEEQKSVQMAQSLINESNPQHGGNKSILQKRPESPRNRQTVRGGARSTSPLIPGISRNDRVEGGALLTVPKKDNQPKQSSLDIAAGFLKHFQRKARLKTPLSDRMKNLKRLRKVRLNEDKMAKLAATHSQAFERLPQVEKDVLQTAFSRYDVDGSGTLDVRELKGALEELGIRGQTEAEKKEILMLCHEVAILGDVDFHHFCLELVPQVRARVAELNRSRLFDQFCSCDADGSGFLSKEECLKVVEDLLNIGSMNVKDVATLLDCFSKLVKDSLIPTNPKHRKISLSAMKEDGQAEEEAQPIIRRKEVEMGIDFDSFQNLVERTREKFEQIQRDRLWTIMQSTSLDQDALRKMQHDIIPLYECFQRFDDDDSGELDRAEVRKIFQEFGCYNGGEEEEKLIDKLIERVSKDGNDSVNFDEFLHLVKQLREEMKLRRREEVWAIFRSYDKDNSGQLSMAEVSMLFTDMGLLPKCQVGQDEIKRLLEESDDDGSGELNFEEFQHLVELVTEKLRALTRVRELELGIDLGYTKKQIIDFRDAFWQLDDEGTGALGIVDLRRIMTMLRVRISGDELRDLFAEVDNDESGCIDFSEFLRLMHMLEEQRQEQEAFARREALVNAQKEAAGKEKEEK